MSECACIDIDDYEGAKVSTTKIVVARLAHKCYECGRQIETKEKYEYFSGLYDYRWYTVKTCLDCVSARKAFFCSGWYYENLWDSIAEHIHHCYSQIGEDIICQLTPRARDIVCDMIQDEWKYEDEDED